MVITMLASRLWTGAAREVRLLSSNKVRLLYIAAATLIIAGDPQPVAKLTNAWLNLLLYNYSTIALATGH